LIDAAEEHVTSVFMVQENAKEETSVKQVASRQQRED
jgi:hypothetical protein